MPLPTRPPPRRDPAGRRRAARARRAVLGLAVAAACGGPAATPRAPSFAPARRGVFVPAAVVVGTTEDDLAPALAPGAARLAYTGRSNGNLEIFVRATAGGAPVRLTSHSTADTDPAFSPDGRRIAWISQAEDVKGDVWIMDADGGAKRRLTGRETAERGPAFSADGRAMYFGSLSAGGVVERIERLEIDSGLRTTVVEKGWDPAPAPGGQVLFYAAADERGRPRLYAMRLVDGRVAALTDGAYIEGMPHAFVRAGVTTVIFCRFVDDQNGDGAADAGDPASLWSVRFDPALFDGAPPASPMPLTAGSAGEVLASATAEWIVFTAGGAADLDVQALPATGTIDARAGAEAILEAARAEDDPALRRLALRYLVATAPALEAPARYELARELAERGKLGDAIDELGRVAAATTGGLVALARVEAERLRLLQRLDGRLLTREAADRGHVEEQVRRAAAIVAMAAGDAAVTARLASLRGEAELALGRRDAAVEAFETLSARTDVPPEDGARALDRLGEIYRTMEDAAAVSRVSRALLSRFGAERHYARRATRRWIETAAAAADGQPLATLELIAREAESLPAAAAQASLAMAEIQASSGREAVAIEAWQRLVAVPTGEPAVIIEALLRLGAVEERRGNAEQAVRAYERLLADHADDHRVRSTARQGLVRIAMRKAVEEDHAGDAAKARESYRLLLRNDRELVMAHRRYIALSAALGRLDGVLAEYGAAARANPRDKLARYGHGYALTFVRPLPLAAAEREVAASLDLDPRLAAAHLTLGWLRERKEEREPRKTWLEEAESAYQTAQQLAHPTVDPELWAAATLNRGNVLFALGSPLAFDLYLARELASVPHDSALSELLFRETFARAALRVDAYDVALDMALGAHRLSRKLAGEARRAPTTALVAALFLVTGGYEDARAWYDDAVALYRGRADWARVVPLLRGRALAEQALGETHRALATTAEILEILGRDQGPPEPPRGLLVIEIAGNAGDVTRAAHGFAPGQEEELARTLASRIHREHGALRPARELDGKRLRLLRAAAKDDVIGPRISFELITALNESAVTALRAAEPADAVSRLREALAVARAERWWREAASLLESLAWVWAKHPHARLPDAALDAAATAEAAMAELGASDPATSGRIARFLALHHLALALAPVGVRPGTATAGLDTLLASLDARAHELGRAAELAARAGDARLALALGADRETRPASGVPAGEIGPDPPGPGGAAPATGAGPKRARTWRLHFDRALATSGTARGAALAAAIDAYEADPTPGWPPERALFLEHAVTALLGHNAVERAWRLLERDRLLDLQPPPSRVRREPVAGEWAALREAQGHPARYAERLAGATTLTRALEGRPAALTAVQTALEGAVLVQAFALVPERWHWFVTDARGVRHASTAAARAALPDPVRALLGDPPAARLFVDTGELWEQPARLLVPGPAAPGGHPEVIETLSATYLVAARELRNLARRGVLFAGSRAPAPDTTVVSPASLNAEKLEALGAERRAVIFDVTTDAEPAPADRAGLTQVALASVPGRTTAVDLDVLGSTALRAGTGVVIGLGPRHTRAARAVAQAFLLAAVPAVLVGHDAGDRRATAARFTTELEARSAAAAFTAVAATAGAELRLVGDPGLDAAGRVTFGYEELLRLAKLAAATFKAAQASPSPGSWRAAKGAFADLLDVIAFLREPANGARLQAAGDERQRRLPQSLPTLEAVNQANLAKVHLALDEVAEAAALQELVVQFYERGGKLKDAAQHTLALGRALSHGKRPRDAAGAFLRCSELARRVDDGATDADCLVRRAAELRAVFDFAGAERAYQEAIMTYARLGAPGEVYPRRYLGFLYESALNNYVRALEQFQAALAVAQRHGDDDLATSLLLDVARVYRLRGDYELALRQLHDAEARMKATNAPGRAEAALEAAKVYWYRGNYRRAMERQRQGLELARRAGNSFLEIQAKSLEGLVALNQGELARAESAVGEALELARLTGRKSEEAAQLNNLGNVLREAGRLTEAVVRFRAALAIDEELGSVEGRAYDLRNLAVALQRQGDPAAAAVALNTALALSRSIGDRYNELQCVFALGELQETAGDPRARESYEQAAALARARSVPEVEWRALYGQARRAAAAGDAVGARARMERALAVAERLGRGRSDSSSSRSRDDLYDDAVQMAVASGDVERAHLLIERARARNLLDVLATRALELSDAGARALTTRELATREAVLAAERDADRGVEGAPAALAKATAAHDAAALELRRDHPRLWRAFVGAPVPLTELRAALGPGVLVASYFVGADATTALVIGRERVAAVRIGVGRRGLETSVRDLRQRLRAFAPVEPQLRELSRLLLEPLLLGPPPKTLVVVPHGALHHVPFAALPVGDEALLDVAAVAFAPSASILHDRLLEPRAGAPLTIAALAPANDLPFARLEAAAVAGDGARFGPEATEEAFRGLRADAVDLAAHAELDPRDPLGSAVVLSRDATQDGRLEVREVFGLSRLPALVSLTACSSAGSEVHGDEWVGLGYAFLTAGSRAVVATLDRVSDLGAAVLAKRFYRLLGSRGPAQALREAALAARRRHAHPAHWATFVLIGDYR